MIHCSDSPTGGDLPTKSPHDDRFVARHQMLDSWRRILNFEAAGAVLENDCGCSRISVLSTSPTIYGRRTMIVYQSEVIDSMSMRIPNILLLFTIGNSVGGSLQDQWNQLVFYCLENLTTVSKSGPKSFLNMSPYAVCSLRAGRPIVALSSTTKSPVHFPTSLKACPKGLILFRRVASTGDC